MLLLLEHTFLLLSHPSFTTKVFSAFLHYCRHPAAANPVGEDVSGVLVTPSAQVHQTRSVLVRDLSIFGQVVYLKVPRRQFYCFTCKKSPTEPLLWVNRKQRQTNRYQEYIYERVSVAGDPPRKELTVKQVSENEKMSVAGHPPRSEDAVQDIFHKVASSKKSGCAHAFVPRRFSAPSKAGDILND